MSANTKGTLMFGITGSREYHDGLERQRKRAPDPPGRRASAQPPAPTSSSSSSDVIVRALIREKAKEVYAELVRKDPLIWERHLEGTIDPDDRERLAEEANRLGDMYGMPFDKAVDWLVMRSV